MGDREEAEMGGKSLYERLGGYDGISAAVDEILPRLMADSGLGRFWKHRGADGLARERQLLIDFLCNASGGPMYYTGRGMKLVHKGMGIGDGDWSAFMGHIGAALDKLAVGQAERRDVLGFVASLKAEIVEG